MGTEIIDPPSIYVIVQISPREKCALPNEPPDRENNRGLGPQRRDLSRPRLQLFVPHARPPSIPTLPSSLSYPFHPSLLRRSRFLASPPFFPDSRSPSSRIHERGPPSIASIRSNKCSLVYTVDLLECLAIGIRLSNARDNVSAPRPERILIRETSNWISNWIFPSVFQKKNFFS